MQVLIVKTSSLGDVIHMLPALSDARRALPGLRCDWLVEEGFAEIPAWHEAVDRAIPLAWRRWRRSLWSAATRREIGEVRRNLRQRPYDLVVDSQGLLKSALWAVQAQGPRAGYDSASVREPFAALFYQARFRVSRSLHAVTRNRQLLAHALGYALAEDAPDYGLAALASGPRCAALNLPPRYLVGLHATSRADKEWPEAHWQALAKLAGARACPLLLPWGSATERARAERIAAAHPSCRVLPRLALGEIAALLAHAQAVIGVDTGLMHLAAALGRPGLALYTATRPDLTGVLPDQRALGALHNLSGAIDLACDAVLARVADLLDAPDAEAGVRSNERPNEQPNE